MTNQDYNDYKKLAEKLANKYSVRSGMSFDDVYSMALEGMVTAFNNYDGRSAKSGYISSIMVKKVLIGIQDECRTVRIPYSRFAKDKEEGISSSSRVSLAGYDASVEKDQYDISPILEYINGLSERDKDIMMSWFGLGDVKLSNKELAQKWKLSPAAITYTVKKICRELGKKFQIEDFID